jgi:uncharacterized protein Usg
LIWGQRSGARNGRQPHGPSANNLFSLKRNLIRGAIHVGYVTGVLPMPRPTDPAPDQPGRETALMLQGYGLTTAEFFYRMPDYRSVLNTFVWQDYDLAPDYPQMFRFIEFWQERIEGPLHSVRFTHRKLIGPGEWRNVVGEFRIH